MSNKTKKNIAFTLLAYLIFVFSAPYAFSNSFKSDGKLNETVVFAAENNSGNSACEVREIEMIKDSETENENQLITNCFTFSSVLYYNSGNLSFRENIHSDKNFPSHIPVYLLNRNLRI